MGVTVKLCELLALPVEKDGKNVYSTHLAELYGLLKKVPFSLGESNDPFLAAFEVLAVSIRSFHLLRPFDLIAWS